VEEQDHTRQEERDREAGVSIREPRRDEREEEAEEEADREAHGSHHISRPWADEGNARKRTLVAGTESH
jgi:hypothetical protein